MQRVGRKAICGAKHSFTGVVSKDLDDYQHRRLTKFKESAWKGLYYLTAELFALAVTYNEPWFTESKQFWVGPGDQRWPNQMTRYLLLHFHPERELNLSACEFLWLKLALYNFVPQFTIPRVRT